MAIKKDSINTLSLARPNTHATRIFSDRKVTFCVIQGTGAQSFGISDFLEMSEDYFCPGCSAHQLLIYRDPGHLARAEAAGTSENIQDANATPVKAKEKLRVEDSSGNDFE